MAEQDVGTARLVQQHTGQVVGQLQREYLPAAGRTRPTSAASATMAALRGADPARLGDDPGVWALVWTDLDPRLQGRTDGPSDAEQAICAGLVLYAIHQQGRLTPMDLRGVSLGAAAGRLARREGADGGLDPAVVRRFTAVALARTSSQRLYHLRVFIKLLRSYDIGLDHALLAADLFRMARPERATRVRTGWARDLYSRPGEADDGSAPADGAPPANDSSENGAA
ncbi:CRISPR system Cascade subunit CasB [Barrientosiimonas humi]|uniref:CRISPR system Cascade subunit CasB n=1 Tax=Barrientosiimonas humi TaxID=999931 RepID=A0A542XFU8_9MICO|nr:type I-E CRISPR-associated protein Cse2/CasB [Barrientosiimonas humi]TQL34698.1 CRISPR system Cascade subunit CasB [Barrientosiimonas humi]CAG7574688.1 hypothetical protein BH39T_PBIAJDOK_03344 [Barrientosiimonas humi]